MCMNRVFSLTVHTALETSSRNNELAAAEVRVELLYGESNMSRVQLKPKLS